MEKIDIEMVRLEPWDWRWSAAIVGLHKYFEFHNVPFKIDPDGIDFDEKDITEERYLSFVEKFFSENMHHRRVEEILDREDISQADLDELKKKLTANVIMKKIFKDIKITDSQTLDREKINKIISENRTDLIRETYRGGRSLYYNFCNESNFFKKSGDCCRLRGYYVDMGKKSKALAFKRDKKNFRATDSRYFDFIPFAFSKSRESIFINNNLDVNHLVASNRIEPDSDDSSIRSKLFDKISNASTFIDYEVEVIVKNRENEYFETLFIRDEAIRIFNEIEKLNKDDFKIFSLLQSPCNIKSRESGIDRWVNIQLEVTNKILNGQKLDYLIESLFKSFKNQSYLNSYLIKINELIYKRGEPMEEREKKLTNYVKIAASEINRKLPTNKVNSYKQKLISGITLRDYDKVQVTLIQLSAYSNVKMDFLVELFNDFEGNKNLAYTFINSLGTYENSNK